MFIVFARAPEETWPKAVATYDTEVAAKAAIAWRHKRRLPDHIFTIGRFREGDFNV